MVYIVAPDLDQAIGWCQARSGQILRAPEAMGGDHCFCVTRDPAGAVAALLESPPERV